MENMIFNGILFTLIIVIPVRLVGWNLKTLYQAGRNKNVDTTHWMIIENIILWLSIFLGNFLIGISVMPEDWHVQLVNNELHTMIQIQSIPTIITLMALSYGGYLFLRLVDVKKQAPLLSSLSIAAIYIGIFTSIMWVIQVIPNFLFALVGVNIIITYTKSIVVFISLKGDTMVVHDDTVKLSKLKEIFKDASNLPVVGLVLALPLLALVIIVLMLFGQEPSSVIKAWTETADWTLSQKVAPQNIEFDNHYLCTVAAGGHPKVVKPLRTGVRHNNRILVNRQLCVANAFEQVIQEHLPLTHKGIRRFYDNTAYPISKHIHSAFLADLIYYIMKPLEWFFLIVLYLVDANPEDRIATQYPHQPLNS